MDESEEGEGRCGIFTEGVTRRAFLGLGALTGAALAGAALQGFVVEPSWLDINHFDIPIAGLPTSLEGYTIAHITDLHLRRLGLLHDMLLTALARISPDLIVMTGDMIETPAGLGPMESFCRGLVGLAAVPILATLGNWEHLTPGLPERLAHLYEGRGIDLLVNEHVLIGGKDIVVAGVDDGTRGNPEVARAVDAMPVCGFSLLLTHSPALFDTWPREIPSFDLGLAGHTHGGQVRLGERAPVLPAGSGRFVSGFYQTRAGRVFVSRGLGTSKVPLRFMCRPELPIFRLTRLTPSAVPGQT